MRVLVAGAGGVIGRRLVPQLVASGHEVVGTTANPWAIEAICKLGGHAAPPAGTGGASNEKARRELGWDPLWRTWRDGFRHGDVTDDWALSSREAWTRG